MTSDERKLNETEYKMRTLYTATVDDERRKVASSDADREWLLIFNNHATERLEIVGLEGEVYGGGIPVPAGDAYEFNGISAKAAYWALFDTGQSGEVRSFEVSPI